MSIQPENIEFREKVLAGIKKAFKKLVEEAAAKNELLVIAVNGKPEKVPAKDILKKRF